MKRMIILSSPGPALLLVRPCTLGSVYLDLFLSLYQHFLHQCRVLRENFLSLHSHNKTVGISTGFWVQAPFSRQAAFTAPWVAIHLFPRP